MIRQTLIVVATIVCIPLIGAVLFLAAPILLPALAIFGVVMMARRWFKKGAKAAR